MRTPGSGRKSKGPRAFLGVRTAEPVAASVREAAEREGYGSMSDYVAAVLARHEGLPHLAPEPIRDQEELPLQRVS